MVFSGFGIHPRRKVMWKKGVVSILDQREYIIAMYLSPKHHNLAISKNFSHDYLKPEIVKLAMNWKFKKDECIQLAKHIHKNNLFSFTKDHKTMTPMSFWKTTQQFTELMRKLASFVFQLNHHYHIQNPKSRTR